MRWFSASALILGISLAPLSVAQTLPRPAREFVVKPVTGGEISLSSLKGKVVCLEFLFTTCPHCQHEAQLLSKLNTEYASKGVAILGVAIDTNLLPGLVQETVSKFIQNYRVNFPVGYAPADSALGFLGVSTMERWAVPQVAIIDKKGMIRAQTPPQSDAKFQQEDYLRSQIEMLLKESGSAAKPKPSTNTGKAPATAKAKSGATS